MIFKLKFKLLILVFWVFCVSLTQGQSSQAQFFDFDYSRSLGELEKGWYNIELPEDIVSRSTNTLNDIRILGLTEDGDSLECPFLLVNASNQGKIITDNKPSFEIINSSKRGEGFYHTFRLLEDKTIDEFKLDFESKNFDWRVNLQGSHEDREWFTILEDYRIVGIQNTATDYQFTTLHFPKSDYKYYRVLIKDQEKPELIKAVIGKAVQKEKVFHEIEVKPKKILEDKIFNHSLSRVSLPYAMSPSEISIEVEEDFDFYRRVEIKYFVDSMQHQGRTTARYLTFKRSILNSWDKNSIQVSNAPKVKDLEIIVFNQDNQPLTISNMKIAHPIYKLQCRIPEKTSVTLLYGNEKARKPQYDLAYFKKNIPENLPNISLGSEVAVAKQKVATPKTLTNKMWLWGILGIAVVLLGWFAVKMLKSVD